MKKILLALMILCVLLTSGCAQNTNQKDEQPEIVEGKYPIKWDDTLIYKNETEIENDLATLENWITEIKDCHGKLDTVDGLYKFINLQYSIEYTKVYDRVNSYCNFGSSVFPLEVKYSKYLNALNDFTNRLNEALSFADEEMMNISYDKRIALFSDEKISKYAFLYSRYLYEDFFVDDDGSSEFYNIATMSHGRMRDTFVNFVDFEIPSAEYKTEKGETYLLNPRTLGNYINGNYSIEEKNKIYDAWWKNVSQYKNTITSILETFMLEQYSNAILSGFDEVKDAKLYEMGFEDDIIQKMIDYAHKYANLEEEYYKLYADKNGEYTVINTTNPLSDYSEGYVNYDDAVEEVLAALAPLGDDYTSNMKEMFTNGHIDVYPADNKSTGAFEMGGYVGLNPFVMFNYRGSYSDIADIAHELGHAGYDILTEQNQDIYDWIMPPFMQELASTTNEMLYYEYKINNSTSDEEKAFFIEKLLDKWVSDGFNACMWQEFEDYCYKTIESGNDLNADDVTEKWKELSKQYCGQGTTFNDYSQYRWLTLQCVYNNYYEFSYATSVCYATVIANNILNNVPGAKDNYLNFLKAGASLSPSDALYTAGINIYDDNIYDQSFNIFAKYVEELKNLQKN